MITPENRNLNGRPIGAKNKVNTELRKTIQNFVESNQDELTARMARLNDSEWLKHYTQLLRFVLPQLKSTTLDFDGGYSFEDVLKQIRFTNE
jgi:hypothetical protein